jgi:hypothetical protein
MAVPAEAPRPQSDISKILPFPSRSIAERYHGFSPSTRSILKTTAQSLTAGVLALGILIGITEAASWKNPQNAVSSTTPKPTPETLTFTSFNDEKPPALAIGVTPELIDQITQNCQTDLYSIAQTGNSSDPTRILGVYCHNNTEADARAKLDTWIDTTVPADADPGKIKISSHNSSTGQGGQSSLSNYRRRSR